MRTTEQKRFMHQIGDFVDRQALLVVIAISPVSPQEVRLEVIANTDEDAVIMHALRDAAVHLHEQIKGHALSNGARLP